MPKQAKSSQPQRHPNNQERYLMRLLGFSSLAALEEWMSQPPDPKSAAKWDPHAMDQAYQASEEYDRLIDEGYKASDELTNGIDEQSNNEVDNMYAESSLNESRQEPPSTEEYMAAQKLDNQSDAELNNEAKDKPAASSGKTSNPDRSKKITTKNKLKLVWGVAVALIVLELLDPPAPEPYSAPGVGAGGPDWTAAFAFCLAIALIAGFLTWLIKES